ncbi:phage holin family protein [Coraliomargarita sp. SDUM461004]|uniref:Phage holin family protein n=1 Tax=Thalassobacterium sedimentorum TaxID=3041258 RepID=A0ABU1ALU7_9BACT|nr:phage holin family protein [Coraliomargarita sp. SDUM461004]MDQ8195183.1 phage holin family protein [Coraliomargarita sp. SDUM461004]
MDLKRLFKSWLLIALGVLIASHIFAGIHYTDTSSLIVAVFLLSLCNIFLKPLLMVFALPFIILSFGLGIWLINALLFLLVGNLVEGFAVDSFGYALAGALVVSLTGAAASLFFGKNKVQVSASFSGGRGLSPRSSKSSQANSHSRKPLKDDDVIDI